MDSPKNLVAALEYAKLGWKVFPLRPKEKRPLSAHGHHDATIDASLIRRWWASTPAAGIGAPTGSTNGFIVLDIDPRNGGDETLKGLLAQYGDLPSTVQSATGGGGQHFFFKAPSGVFPSATPWPGVDIKADGGYVAVPFTIHPSGVEYRWEKGKDPALDMAPCPEWIIEVLKDNKAARLERVRNRESEDAKLEIPAGQRNSALTSLAGTMHRRAVSPEGILVALLAENEVKCNPPLEEMEVKAIVDSIIGRYSPDASASIGQRKTPPKKLVISFSDNEAMRTGPPPPVEWLLENRLAKGDCSVLSGPPGCGKSWIALDLAVAGGAGLPPLGYFQMAKPLRTLIVDEENPGDEVHRRYFALCRAWGILDSSEVDSNVKLTRPCQGLSFRTPGFRDALVEEIKVFKPDLVILDSITALSDIRDEADAVQVRKFFHDQLYPLRDVCGSTILCLHHTSKAVYQQERVVADEGLARGSIDFHAAPDSAILLLPNFHAQANSQGHVRMTQTKARRGRKPENLVVKIVDGQEGGSRPMVLKNGTSKVQTPSPFFLGDSKQARAKRAAFEFIKGSSGEVSAMEVIVEVHSKAPGVEAQDTRAALRSLVERGYIDAIEGTDKRTSSYKLSPREA